jgi:PAS domain S-box-containing protein
MNLPTLNRRKKASVLVVEDEAIVRADVEDYLKSFGYRLAGSVASGEEAKRLAVEFRPDLVLMDIMLAGKLDGIQAGKYIQTRLGIPVVFVTAHGDEDTLERAKLNAPFGYVLKPFNDRELRTAIEIAIFRHRTEEELRRLQQWLKAILDNMEEAVVVTDKWGFITLFNERAASLTGWNGKKAVGKALDEVVRLVNGDSRQTVAAPISDVVVREASQSNHQRLIIVAAKGAETPVHLSMAPMADSRGGVTGTILKFQPVEN